MMLEGATRPALGPGSTAFEGGRRAPVVQQAMLPEALAGMLVDHFQVEQRGP